MNHESATINVKGKEFTVSFKKVGNPRVNARFHVWLTDELENLFVEKGEPKTEHFPHLNIDSVYTVRGEYPEVDKAWDQFNRQLIKAKREVIHALDSAVELNIGDRKIAWRWNAGCACGCSPGFLVRDYPFDVYITVKKSD